MTKYEGKERAYYASLKFALEDGMIDHAEFTHLSDVREQLGITIELHNKMESEIRAAAPPLLSPLPSSSVKDSVISKSTITTVGGDYIDDRDTIQYGTGDIENYAKMCIDAVQSGKLKDGVDIFHKAKEINIEEAKEIFLNKYGKEIAAAYVIAAVPLLEAVKTGDLGYMGLIFTQHFNECTVCLGNALAFDPDNIAANIMQGQAYLTFRKRSSPSRPDLVKKEVIERFEKALSLEPNNQEAQVGLVEARQMSTATHDCFITTATVNYMGEADNGQTLTALRNFRDTVMNKTANGRKQLDWYYENAPEIVKSLDSLENKEEVYTKLYNSYIFPAANAYRNRQKHDTFNLYKKGIQFAFKCIDSKSLI